MGLGGVTADDDRGCYDHVWPPVWPRFTVDIAVFEVKFDIAVFELKFVEFNVNFFRYNLPLSIGTIHKFINVGNLTQDDLILIAPTIWLQKMEEAKNV